MDVVHVVIYESAFTSLTGLYRPAVSYTPLPSFASLMGENAFDSRCKTIESANNDKQVFLDYLKRRLADAGALDDDDEAEDKKAVETAAWKTINAFEQLLKDVKDWADNEKHIMGHFLNHPQLWKRRLH